MNRKSKNIILSSILIILLGVTGLTIKFAIDNKKISTSSSGGPSMGEPPSMNSSDSNSSSNAGTPPEKPSGDNSSNSMGEPPSMNSSDSNSSSDAGTPPEKPSGDNSSNSMGEPPSMNSSDSNSSSNAGTPPEKPSGDNSSNSMGEPPSGAPNANGGQDNNSNSSIDTKYYILFGVEGLAIGLILVYLIMSNFNKKSCKETLKGDKKIIYLLSAILVAGLTLGGSYLLTEKLNNKSTNNFEQKMSKNSDNNVSSDASGSKEVTDTQTLSESYESTTSDESAILVKDGGNATISGAKVNKSGDSSNTENSEFYGINAGILVTKNSTATIKDTTINTSAKGANAVFSTGTDSKIYLSNTIITTTGSSSARGLDATYGGYIEADNVTITTKGGSCATLATDRGEGTVKVTDSKLETNGSGSPVIYSTGDISITNTTGTANGSQMVVIEGKNSATVINSTLNASAKGNRGTTDQAGIMIYQSMSGDASEGTGTFTSKNSTLTIQKNSDYYKSAPMFFITNTDAVINLENTKLEYGSNVLISAKGTSEWGNSGSNGGNLTINATKQELVGNIEVDKISTLVMNLTNSTYEGTINSDNSAKSITLKLDKNSKIKLTSDSYITTLDNEDTTNSNIDFNGYKLYVNGTSIN